MLLRPCLLLPGLIFSGLPASGPARAANLSAAPVYQANPMLYDGSLQQMTGGVHELSRPTSTNTFRFPVLVFDVSVLTPGLTKTLTLTAGSSLSPVTGTLVALGAEIRDTDGGQDGDFADISGPADPSDYAAMMAAAAIRRTWYEENVRQQTTLGIFTFAGSAPVSVDVTSIVDEWIGGTRANFGFALYSTSYIGIYSGEHFNPEFHPVLTQVPESGTAGLALLGGLVVLLRRGRS